MIRIFSAVLSFLLLSGAAAAADPFPWPEGKKAAVVLTYDDSMRTHLEVAIPQLDAAGLKGSFYLNGTFPQEDVTRWRAAAANGHELGSHSVFHPCAAGSFEMPEQYHLENYSIQTMLNELRVMNTFLHAIDGKTSRTYANPCGQSLAGGEDFVGPVTEAGLFTAMRGIAAPEHDPRKIALNAVPSEWFGETATGDEMIAKVKTVEADGGLLVLGFHGVGGDYLIVPGESHQALVTYLADNRDKIWVATFAEATAWVAAQQAKEAPAQP